MYIRFVMKLLRDFHRANGIKKLTRTILLLVGLLASAAPASAVTICYPREDMLSHLARDYAASRQAHGILRPHSVMELWVSERTGDWIIVTTDLAGSSCILAYGEDYSVSPRSLIPDSG